MDVYGDDDDDGDDVVEILGCTYADANNYNSEAQDDIL